MSDNTSSFEASLENERVATQIDRYHLLVLSLLTLQAATIGTSRDVWLAANGSPAAIQKLLDKYGMPDEETLIAYARSISALKPTTTKQEGVTT
jgi:hypothetical protein